MSNCTNCQSRALTASGLSRRHFLASSSALAVTAVLAACGDGSAGGSATGPSNVKATVRLSDFAALNTVGGIAVVSGGGTPIAVVRSATATYRAFSLVCPHQGSTVGISGTGFRCPNHGATFNESGTWTGGQRTSSLLEFTVVANQTAGTITITS